MHRSNVLLKSRQRFICKASVLLAGTLLLVPFVSAAAFADKWDQPREKLFTEEFVEYNGWRHDDGNWYYYKTPTGFKLPGVKVETGWDRFLNFTVKDPTPFVTCDNFSDVPADLTGKILIGKSELNTSSFPDAGEGWSHDQRQQAYAEYQKWFDAGKQAHALGVLLVEENGFGRWDFKNIKGNDDNYPFALISLEAFNYFKSHPNERIYSEVPHADLPPQYSSWGVTTDFVMRPDIIAAGAVRSSFGRYNPDSNDRENAPFGNLEGTSMATPTVAGASALVKQFFKDNKLDLQGKDLVRALRTQLQNTAFTFRGEDGVMITPRYQGAGELNVDLATANTVLIQNELKDNDYESGLGKVNLRDSIRPGGPSDGRIAFNLDLRNFGKEDITMTSAELIILVDKVKDKKVALSSKEAKRVALQAPTIAAGSSTRVSVDTSFKDCLNTTMKEVNAVSPNGFFVDGFVVFKYFNTGLNKTVELSVPFVGFYGDWMRVPVLERSIYHRDKNDLPLYGKFSGVLQELTDDRPKARVPYFTHFSGEFNQDQVVLGADWDYTLADFRPEDGSSPKNPSVLKDKIAVSPKGNGVKNLDLWGPAMRNWLAVSLSLESTDGTVILKDEQDYTESNQYISKDNGKHAADGDSNSSIADENNVRRKTKFARLPIDASTPVEDGVYTLHIKIRPDVFNMRNPIMKQEAESRGFSTFWQEETYPIIIDSLPPDHISINSQDNKTLTIHAEDSGSGVREYRLLDPYGIELAKSHDGVFTVQDEWGPLGNLRFEIYDYAFNHQGNTVGSYLNASGFGSIQVTTNCSDPQFSTGYYAVCTDDGPFKDKAYYDLGNLPVGNYKVYLLNPSAGFVADEYEKSVSLQEGETAEISFNFTADSSNTWYLSLNTDRVFYDIDISYEEWLPGLRGSTYSLYMTDKNHHIRYIYSPTSSKKFNLVENIMNGDYLCDMPGLKTWKATDPHYQPGFHNYKLGVQYDDDTPYTSSEYMGSPSPNRGNPLSSINTSKIPSGSLLEYFFYYDASDPLEAAAAVSATAARSSVEGSETAGGGDVDYSFRSLNDEEPAASTQPSVEARSDTEVTSKFMGSESLVGSAVSNSESASASGEGAASPTELKRKPYLRDSYHYELEDRIGYREAWERSYKGAGMLIAVIDNGLQVEHPSFQKAAADSRKNKIASAEALSALKAQNQEALLKGVYFNEKIPYAYNYEMESAGAYDIAAHGNTGFDVHGAHVAGIAAANPFYDGYPENLQKVHGVAPEAQLAIMNIAGYSGYTAASEGYYPQAIYDAVALGADVVSVSMGSGVGTTRNVSNALQEAIDYAENHGVLIVFSAGNSGTFGRVFLTELYHDKQSNLVKDLYDINLLPDAENPDYGTINAPGAYMNTFAVGSYGAQVSPFIDTAEYNESGELTYTTPYRYLYDNERLFLTTYEQPKDPEDPEETTVHPPSLEPVHEGDSSLVVGVSDKFDKLIVTFADGSELTATRSEETGVWVLKDGVSLREKAGKLEIPVAAEKLTKGTNINVKAFKGDLSSELISVKVQDKAGSNDSSGSFGFDGDSNGGSGSANSVTPDDTTSMQDSSTLKDPAKAEKYDSRYLPKTGDRGTQLLVYAAISGLALVSVGKLWLLKRAKDKV